MVNIIAAIVIATIAGILLVTAAIAFLKAKDIFMMNQVLKITHFYIFPLILIAIEIERFSLVSTLKIAAIIIANILIALLICHVTSRKALTNKITPDVS